MSKISRSKFTAIDIGTHTTKIMEVEQHGDKIIIHSMLEVETPKKFVKDRTLVDFRGLISMINLNLNRTGKGFNNVKLVLSTDQIQHKLVAYPFTGDTSIKSAAEVDYTVHFEDKNHTMYSFDYGTLGQYQHNGILNTSVVLTNIPVITSHEIHEAFVGNKLRLTDLDIDVSCLSRSLLMFGNMHNETKTMLHMGNSQSMLIFMKGDAVIFNRTFAFGYQHLIKELQDQLDIQALNAETMIRFVGLDGLEEPDEQEEQVKRIIEEATRKFVTDIDKSFRHVKHQFQFDVSQVILSGGFSKLKGLDEYLTRSLGTQFAELGTNENWGLNGVQLSNQSDIPISPEFAQVLGLSVRSIKYETN